MRQELIENQERYLERISMYKSFGYDSEKERNNIIDTIKPSQGTILEIGTGKGYLTVALAKAGFAVESIDLSEEEQSIAKMNLQYSGLENNVQLQICNAEQLPYKRDSFNVVISVNLVHHLLNPFIVMDEIVRVLSEQGKIIISDFSEEGFALVDKVHRNEGKEHEVQSHNMSDILHYFEEKNFNIEDMSSHYQQGFIAHK